MIKNDRTGVELSIIDRIIDQDNSGTSRVLAGLRRDLEDLLNTVIRARWPNDELNELDNSVANFGTKDLLTTNFSTPSERAKVLEYIKTVINTYEPRLNNVIIEENSDPEVRSHLLKIKIIGETIIYDNPEEVTFSSDIDVSSGVITTAVFLS